MSPRPPLLFYLCSAEDRQRHAVAPALAALAERAGAGFELYVDGLRRGRHFGGGVPEEHRPGVAGGGLLRGGMHAERALWLARRFAVLALGDPASPLWPALEEGGAEALARTVSPSELYGAALERLRLPVPPLVRVLDAAPQGPHGVRTAPYLYPLLLAGPPALALDVRSDARERAALEAAGARAFEAAGAAPEAAARFAGGLDGSERLPVGEGYGPLTLALARRHAGWGRGLLLGDPDLVAAQLPKARRLRLLPLYGRAQADVVREAAPLVRRGREPVYGRQYDDRDFFALAAAGHGLQVVDPAPPFDAAQATAPARGEPPEGGVWAAEPDEAQLARWADEGRVLVTLVFWCGMLRELDALPRLIDLVAETGLAAGVVLTAETYEHGAPDELAPLAIPVRRGGVMELLEPLLGSTGRGVAAEAYLPPGALAASLREALATVERLAPPALRPRGWWPLLDARLRRRAELPRGRRDGRPVLRYPALRGAARAVGALGLASLLEPMRPFDGRRPGAADAAVRDAVRGAGLRYMWTKCDFGSARAEVGRDGFAVLPFTAGTWGGWSPFYTVAGAGELRRAERRLLRGGSPGWLAGTIDSPLFALSGEVWQNGGELYKVAATAAAGGASGRLLNVTPHVVARYARLLHARAHGGENAGQAGPRAGSSSHSDSVRSGMEVA